MSGRLSGSHHRRFGSVSLELGVVESHGVSDLAASGRGLDADDFWNHGGVVVLDELVVQLDVRNPNHLFHEVTSLDAIEASLTIIKHLLEVGDAANVSGVGSHGVKLCNN